MNLSSLSIFWHVLIAMMLGGALGLERERLKKPAGLRTHIYVAMAACILVFLGSIVVANYTTTGPDFRGDPIRIIQAIVIALGFIGGGTIVKNDQEVTNLTTAASILLAGALGIMVALNKIVLAILLGLLIVFMNYSLRIVEKKFFTK